jgi:para-aminobenzoate synthetase/4-amino-4-deoxychorismate lyase
MATNYTSSAKPRAEKMGDVLDALSSGIAKTAANEPKFEPQHLAREVPAEPTRQLLTEQARALCETHPTGLWRARCCVAADGQARLEAFALEASPESVQLVWAREPFAAAHSEWVRHKTTRRAHYDAATVQAPGVFDTLLYNAEGEITECVRGNIAALIDGQWLTPALHCGLLPGVGRALALREGRVQEAVIRREDAHRVQAWAFLNSLRGWLPATVHSPAGFHEHVI